MKTITRAQMKKEQDKMNETRQDSMRACCFHHDKMHQAVTCQWREESLLVRVKYALRRLFEKVEPAEDKPRVKLDDVFITRPGGL